MKRWTVWDKTTLALNGLSKMALNQKRMEYHNVGSVEDQELDSHGSGSSAQSFEIQVENSVSGRSRWRRYWAIFLYSLTTMLLYADQNLLAPNLTQIANDFGFTEQERDTKLGGDIALAFFVLGAPASFLVGMLGDQYNRMVLFGITVGIGEGACVATYFTQSYRYLYCTRAITGLALGGALPLIYSVLGDWFRARDRHLVSAIVGAGTGAGIAVGQGVSGFLGPTFGWRMPFLVIGLPAVVCAGLVVFTVPDPERGAMEEAVIANNNTGSREELVKGAQNVSGDLPRAAFRDLSWTSHWRSLKRLLQTPTVVLLLLQGAPGCVPWGVVNTYLNDFLAEDRGMSVEGATVAVLCLGIGNFWGLMLGGAGGRYCYRRSVRYPPLLAGAMAILGCFPFWVVLNGITSDTFYLLTGAITILAGIFIGATGPIVKATLQNVTLPTARGQAFALFNTFDDFGRGLGPVFVASLIKKFGRTRAFNVAVLGWVFCGFFNLVSSLTVQGDEELVQQTLTEQLREGAIL